MYIVNKTHSYARTHLQYIHTNARKQIHKRCTGHIRIYDGQYENKKKKNTNYNKAHAQWLKSR